MAKDKKELNPAAAQRKADKQKALKKGKALVQAQRNERLAHRNPERLQTQIDDLKSLEASSGKLSARDKKTLEDLERDVQRVKKAKEVVGDKYAEQRKGGLDARGGRGGRDGGRGVRNGGREGGVFGKRGRDGEWKREEESEETDEDVRVIPMPKDTPPPVPHQQRNRRKQEPEGHGSSANAIPLGRTMRGAFGEVEDQGQDRALAKKPEQPVVQTVYESKPVVRDLRKEALGFVPSAVRRKIHASKGGVESRLLEEEEIKRLEEEGYVKSGEAIGTKNADEMAAKAIEEEESFRREMRQVEMEEVEDEDL